MAKLLENQAEKFDIPSVPKPDCLSFHRFLQLEEIFLTPNKLISEEGRTFITQVFSKDNWGKKSDVFEKFSQRLVEKRDEPVGFYTPNGQLVTQFSKKLKTLLLVNRQMQIQLKGFTTTLFYQQNMDYYISANYTGTETSHYLIMPFVRFRINI